MSSRRPDPESDTVTPRPSPRTTRLAEALRANLLKRKEQSRARRGGGADERRDGTLVDAPRDGPRDGPEDEAVVGQVDPGKDEA